MCRHANDSNIVDIDVKQQNNKQIKALKQNKNSSLCHALDVRRSLFMELSQSYYSNALRLGNNLVHQRHSATNPSLGFDIHV